MNKNRVFSVVTVVLLSLGTTSLFAQAPNSSATNKPPPPPHPVPVPKPRLTHFVWDEICLAQKAQTVAVLAKLQTAFPGNWHFTGACQNEGRKVDMVVGGTGSAAGTPRNLACTNPDDANPIVPAFGDFGLINATAPVEDIENKVRYFRAFPQTAKECIREAP